MLRYFTICLLLVISFDSLAQGEIDNQSKSSTRDERTFHLMLASNGMGGGFSYAKMKTVYLKKLFNIELVGVHDVKEYVITSSNGDRYVYGKSNAFYCLRNQYGLQKQLFSKRDKGGIEIRYYYLAGIDIGFLKPIYYINTNGQTTKSLSSIEKKAPFYRGISETKIIPGIALTAGSSFEFSKRDRGINALEGGLIFDLYPKKIELMANDYNKIWFLGFFISLRFGKIINPRIKEEKPVSIYKNE
jgi:hypothetical protein